MNPELTHYRYSPSALDREQLRLNPHFPHLTGSSRDEQNKPGADFQRHIFVD
jgi:hypothetical protein